MNHDEHRQAPSDDVSAPTSYAEARVEAGEPPAPHASSNGREHPARTDEPASREPSAAGSEPLVAAVTPPVQPGNGAADAAVASAQPVSVIDMERADVQRADTERADTERAHTERAHTERAHTESAHTERAEVERNRTALGHGGGPETGADPAHGTGSVATLEGARPPATIPERRHGAAGSHRHAGPPRGRPGSARHRKSKGGGSFLSELPFLILVAFGLALLIKAFLVQAFFIPSGSMERTLLIKDRVLVNKLVYHFRDIHRGEIVVFNGLDSFTPEFSVAPPASGVQRVLRGVAGAVGLGQPGEKDFIKRVIGIPGDTVACCDDRGRVTVNDVPLDEPYIYQNNDISDRAFGPITVPPGRLWVMGDHRSFSADSRSHVGETGNGTVPADKVIGRAFVIVWPPTRAAVLRVPKTFTRSALPGAGADTIRVPAAAAAGAPYALGLVGALPLTVLRRRRRTPGRAPAGSTAANGGRGAPPRRRRGTR